MIERERERKGRTPYFEKRTMENVERKKMVPVEQLENLWLGHLVGRHVSRGLGAGSSAHAEVGFVVRALEGDARMQQRHEDDGEADHGGLQDHEGHLVLGQVAVEAFAKLGHTEDRAGEDGEGRDDES